MVIAYVSIFALIASSCGQTPKKQVKAESDTQDIHDTIVIKCQNILNESVARWYSQSCSYYWIAGKDTLDFKLSITESKVDGALSLNLLHKEPILFTDALEKIDVCLPLIKEDFDTSKLTSIHFKEPIFYLDLAKKLSSEYEQEFGRKRVDKWLPFLLKSSLTSQLNYFLNPLNKKVRHYGFEKFQLLDKENYKEYLPNINFTEYPEFTLNSYNGMSVSISKLKNVFSTK